MSAFTFRDEREVRGVPAWLVEEYLQKLGGQWVRDGVYKGDGWRVSVEPLPPEGVGSLRIGRVRLVTETRDKATFDAFFPRLHLKLLRGGG